MPAYIIQVELEGFQQLDYNKLDEVMTEDGFSKTVKAINTNEELTLLRGMYFKQMEKTDTADTALTVARDSVQKVGVPYKVVVSQQYASNTANLDRHFRLDFALFPHSGWSNEV